MTTVDLIDEQPVLRCPDAHLDVLTLEDALDLVGDAFSAGVRTIVVPARRLPQEFFVLRSGFAGEFVHIFAKYHLRLIVSGDVSDAVAKSPTFAAFVSEANRGREIRFIPG